MPEISNKEQAKHFATRNGYKVEAVSTMLVSINSRLVLIYIMHLPDQKVRAFRSDTGKEIDSQMLPLQIHYVA